MVTNEEVPFDDPAMDMEETSLRRRPAIAWTGESNPETKDLKNTPLEENDCDERSSCSSDINETKVDELDMAILAHMVDQAEEVVMRIIQASWSVCHFNKLPNWLQDNDFITHGHRPPLPSFRACFKSIFRVHSETGNIWTHMIGCLFFICTATYFLINPELEIQFQEKVVFGIFFAGAIICLGFSFTFHTVICHSQFVSKVFSKLDYCGISLLIMGSSVPWLYYSFYCHFQPKLIYLVGICTLGIATIMVSLLDRFAEPAWRSFRAGLFIAFGLSGVVPAVHYGFMEGWFNSVSQKSLGWLSLMAVLYISGAILYAFRFPERFFPGKFDIWLHSHQIFHVFVIGAALVHFHGVTELAMHRVTVGQCEIVDTLVY